MTEESRQRRCKKCRKLLYIHNLTDPVRKTAIECKCSRCGEIDRNEVSPE